MQNANEFGVEQSQRNAKDGDLVSGLCRNPSPLCCLQTKDGKSKLSQYPNCVFGSAVARFYVLSRDKSPFSTIGGHSH